MSVPVVNTVLGPIPASELGVVAPSESLLSVLPGAQYAFDITIDRAEIFDVLAAKLTDFYRHGGRTIVDNTGMFHGRDLRLLEALSKHTRVNIVASTGFGPEELLGGYFLTPQTNPPTPWPAEKFAQLFSQEVVEGMVVPRIERRAAAGLITTVADLEGITPTEVSLFQGGAAAARDSGVPLQLRWGSDALTELGFALDAGLAADRIVLADIDRVDSVSQGVPLAAAARGVFVGIDHIGTNADSRYIDDEARVKLVAELIDAGHESQILLSSSATGVAKAVPEVAVPFSTVLSSFVPQLLAAGIRQDVIDEMLIDNPRVLLAVQSGSTR